MKTQLKKIVLKIELVIIRFILPISWPLISKILKQIAKTSVYVKPRPKIYKQATIIISTKKRPKKRSLNYDELAKNWAIHSLKIPNVQFRSDSLLNDADIFIFTNEWFKSNKQHLYFFLPTIILAKRIKKAGKPIWVLVGDTYNLKIIIPASILVALCGGSIILQQNTTLDGKRFGLTHPTGSVFWLFTPDNLGSFKSNVKWTLRPRIMIVSASGDMNRIKFINDNQIHFKNLNYRVIEAKHQFKWNEYCDLLKQSRINLSLSTLQSHVIDQNYLIKNKLSKFTVTNRVWEGFCSGALVITNDNPILRSYGLFPSIHFLDISEMEKSKFDLPNESTLARIAKTGQKKFFTSVLQF